MGITKHAQSGDAQEQRGAEMNGDIAGEDEDLELLEGHVAPLGKRPRETETPASPPPEQQQLGAFMVALMGKNSNDVAEVGVVVPQ